MITIASVGRLCTQKRPDRFVAVAAEVLKHAPETRFVWIGDGELRAKIEAQALQQLGPGKLTITGWVERVRLQEHGVTIYLSTSDYESFGYAVLEAMQAGLPCVISQTTGHCDLITHEVHGALVPTQQVQTYADTLLRLIADPSLRKQWGEAASQRCEKTFSVRSMIDSTDRLYRQLLGGTGGGQ